MRSEGEGGTKSLSQRYHMASEAISIIRNQDGTFSEALFLDAMP
ncbi:MAG: hypothetical protein AB1442_01400 [Nitrospirota bacterium]